MLYLEKNYESIIYYYDSGRIYITATLLPVDQKISEYLQQLLILNWKLTTENEYLITLHIDIRLSIGGTRQNRIKKYRIGWINQNIKWGIRWIFWFANMIVNSVFRLIMQILEKCMESFSVEYWQLVWDY